MFTTYHDFEIAIEPGKSNRFPFSVSGPGGDARGILRLPTNNATYQGLARRLEALDTDETMLVQIGQILFDMLFQGQVKEMYRASQGMLQQDEGLRIRLSLGAAQGEVAALPWELLTDPDQGPLALLDAPIVRYLQQPVRIPTLATQLPLKVLVTGAQTPPLTEVQRELQLVKTALEGLGQHVKIEVVEHLTPNGLQQRLRSGFHVWHFVGHGGFTEDGKTAQLYFEDANGDAQPVSALQLGILLNRSGVRLIVLDACNSARIATEPFHSLAPALIRAQIPAVIAMQFTVPEDTTKAFASEFYKALAEGFPIDACVTEGRKAVMNETGLNNPDWGIPVVYTRAPDGKLFDLPTAPEVQVDSSPPPPGWRNGKVDYSGAALTDPSTTETGEADEINALDDQIKIHRRRLNKLELQKATYGISADPSILIQIEDLQKEIANIELKKKQLRGQ